MRWILTNGSYVYGKQTAHKEISTFQQNLNLLPHCQITFNRFDSYYALLTQTAL